MKLRVYLKGKIRTIKPGITFKEIKAKYPDAIKVGRIPTQDELEEWSSDGGCEALDGCWTEPDGYCEHNMPSWLLALGYI